MCIGGIFAVDQNSWEEIRQGQLFYDYVWEFMEIVNSVSDYEMINPIMFSFEDVYNRAENETHLDDLQIFYGGDYGTGHYVCTFYNASLNSVFVYDNMTDVCDRTQDLIKLRYPTAKVVPLLPDVKKPDDESCGVFAVAYATAIIFHHDPATLPLKIDHNLKNKTTSLRVHLFKILKEKLLEMFPSE